MAAAEPSQRFEVLDGWRGISILLVLAAHLLPLGPKAWELNEAAGAMGMALFFTLSGFLITRFLLTHASIPDFLIRRTFRIVPLAWLSMAVAFPLAGTAASDYLPNFLFYANLPPQHLAGVGAHLWSLGVEMQFYAGIAVLVALFGKPGLHALPLLCLAVTLHRVSMHAYLDIVTWRRVDEILAGALLAMAHAGKWGRLPATAMSRANVYVLLVLVAIACHPAGGFANYLRPYLAAALVGCTLLARPAHLTAALESRVLRYVAAISFALYVLHGLLINTWLGEGDKWVKYLKRPLLLIVTFGLAHVSTFYFEQRWIALGKRLSRRLPSSTPVPAPKRPLRQEER